MKAAVVCAGCLLLLIGLVVLVGSFLPKRHVASRGAVFHATPEQLYALIAGPQTWRPDVARSETFSDATGREMQRDTDRKGEAIVYEISARTPPYGLSRRIASEGLPYSGTWTYSLQAEADGTRLRITEDGQVSNPVFRFMSRFVLGHTRTIDQYLQALGNATGQRDLKITN